MSLFVGENEEDNYQDQGINISTNEFNEVSENTTSNLGNWEPEIPVEISEEQEVPVYSEKTVSSNLPLRFQREILEDMLSKDGLLLLARGLGWDTISANLLHALSAPSIELLSGSRRKQKKSLIFVLNSSIEEIIRLTEQLRELNWLDNVEDESPLVDLSSEVQSSSSKRAKIYSQGGIVSVTARVLVVDILSGALPSSDITGLFILHAEKVRDSSNISFIINLYRDKNDWGFIKAVSDDPESFTGFTPLASKLRLLRLSNVFLWPRFHVEVSMSLNFRGQNMSAREKQATEHTRLVTEINTKLSYKMNKIQSAILACIQACLQELKRHNPTLDTEYWDMENIHDPNFFLRIRMSLEPHWHRLTYTSKQLIYDLDTLSDLLDRLVTVDSISFYQIVQGIIDLNIKRNGSGSLTPTTMSPWLNLDESNTIISYSRERALGQMKVSRTIKMTDGASREVVDYEYVLEELPKWNQLGVLLDDIIHEKSINFNKDSGPILIMCSSARLVTQLGTLLKDMKEDSRFNYKHFSFRKYMVQKLNSYLEWKKVSHLAKKLSMEINSNETSKEGHSEEHKEEENDQEQLNISKTFSRSVHPISKRRRTRGASATARVAKLYTGINGGRETEAVDIDNEILQRLRDNVGNDESQNEDDPFVRKMGKDERLYDSNLEIEENEKHIDDELIEQKSHEVELEHILSVDQIIIQTYDEFTSDCMLQELSPSYVIMYEPNLAFIRSVEIYQAIHRDNPAKTYFMYYGTSVEEQKHLLRIKKEKDAFTRLIREKAGLAKHFETAEDQNKLRVRKADVVNTRIAGGARFRTESEPFRVLIDVREFTSSLPNLLYRAGIDAIPLMLTVGDYIISPKICIERKSIPDLMQSFKSGRLFHQCEQMFRHYELPTLLIEFDESKSFSLEPFSESRYLKTNPASPSSDQLLQQSIQSKILSLLMSYPKLKIIWSSSPTETAQIFLTLKSNQEEPDIEEALDKGVNRTLETDDGGPPAFNEEPIDLLQTIPGINNVNYFTIIQRIKSMEELVKLSKEKFVELLGEENGRKAFNFINYNVK